MDVSELKQIVDIFVHEADESLTHLDQQIVALEKDGATDARWDIVCRLTRTLKGSAAALGYAELAEFCQYFEKFILSIKEKDKPLTSSSLELIKKNRMFIGSHISALRSGSKSPGRGESLIQAMEKEKEFKPSEPLILLPRPPLAGDIWFVRDDLKAELFELPEVPSIPVEPEKPILDPKLLAIQAEISRLTQLAAAVNLTSVQVASRIDEVNIAGETNPEWSLQGVEKILDTIEVKTQLRESVEGDVKENSTNEETNSIDSEITLSEKQETQPETNRTTQQTVHESEQVETNANAQAQIIEIQAHDIEKNESITAKSESTEQSQDTNIKINLSRIDNLIQVAGELVMIHAALDENKNTANSQSLEKCISQMSKHIRDLKELSTSLRLVSIQPIFTKTAKLSNYYSKKHSKKTNTIFVGEENKIDKDILSRLTLPLTELVRNAIEHGIEPEEERITAGKTAEGHLKLQIQQNSRHITIEVADDGRGLDINNIKERAIAKGLMTARDHLNDDKIRALIFDPDYSDQPKYGTNEKRPTGLALIAKQLERLGASIEIASSSTQGTTFRILIPRRLSIVDALIIRLGEDRFIVEKSQISETLHSEDAEIDIIQGSTRLLNLRGITMPLLNLTTLLKKSDHEELKPTFNGTALAVIEHTKSPFAVVVDDIINEQLVVIKKLGRELQGIKGLNGAAILGDGKPAIILDLVGLLEEHMNEQFSSHKDRAA